MSCRERVEAAGRDREEGTEGEGYALTRGETGCGFRGCEVLRECRTGGRKEETEKVAGGGGWAWNPRTREVFEASLDHRNGQKRARRVG